MGSKIVNINQYQQVTHGDLTNISKYIYETFLLDLISTCISQNQAGIISTNNTTIVQQDNGSNYNFKFEPCTIISSTGQLLINVSEQLITNIAPVSSTRIDIVEVTFKYTAQNSQSRYVIDPTSGNLSTTSLNTEILIDLQINIKKGNEGTGIAPLTDTGYVKIAEIIVNTVGGISNSNIYNVTSIFGENNIGWTEELANTILIKPLQQHRLLTTLDHPNGSVTNAKLSSNSVDDTKIGNRDITGYTTITPTGLVATLTTWLQNFARMLVKIVGKTNWYDTPTNTLEQVNTNLNNEITNRGTAISNEATARINAINSEANTRAIQDGYRNRTYDVYIASSNSSALAQATADVVIPMGNDAGIIINTFSVTPNIYVHQGYYFISTPITFYTSFILKSDGATLIAAGSNNVIVLQNGYTDILIQGFNIWGTYFGILYGVTGIVINTNNSNVVLKDINVSGFAYVGIEIYSAYDVLLDNVKSSDNCTGFYVYNSYRVTFRNCYAFHNTLTGGFSSFYSKMGLVLMASYNCNITGLYTYSNANHGIFLCNSNVNSFCNCYTFDNGVYGLIIDGVNSNNNVISSCICTSNTSHAIVLGSAAEGNIIQCCKTISGIVVSDIIDYNGSNINQTNG